jgi:AraC-like DNA-binding protein
VKIIFNLSTDRKIIIAGQNVFLTPQPHPTRLLEEHVISYVIKGGWKLNIGGEIISAKADTIFIQPANITHTGIKNCPAGTQTMFIHFANTPQDGITKEESGDNPTGGVCINALTDISGNPEIKRLFIKVINEYKNKDTVKALAYFNVLLCELSDSRSSEKSKQELGSNIKNMLIDPTDSLTNKEIARRLNVGVRTVETIFKELYGATIHQYRLAQKIKQAKFYLEYYPQMKTADIALNLGFYDEFHFSRQFKRIVGVSPTEYKKTSISQEALERGCHIW